MKTFLAVIGGIVFFPVWIAISAILNAFVLTKLWWWFVIPTFHTKPLSLALAYGLILIFTFLTYNYHKAAADTNAAVKTTRSFGTTFAQAFTTSLLVPFSALGVGWIAHFFV